MIRLIFDDSNYGFSFADTYRSHYQGVEPPVPFFGMMISITPHGRSGAPYG